MSVFTNHCKNQYPVINHFMECIDASYPSMESHQPCGTADVKHLVEEITISCCNPESC